MVGMVAFGGDIPAHSIRKLELQNGFLYPYELENPTKRHHPHQIA
jgi:hypothetical protein